MRSTTSVLAAIALILVVQPAAAEIASSIAVVPVVAKNAGAVGTNWMTELSLTNVSGYLVNVEARFFEENKNNIILFVPVKEFQLADGQTLTVNDVLAEWFPSKRETKGYLLITAEPPGATEQPVAIAVTARVFNNADPSATYGQAVPSSLLNVVMGAAKAVLPGAQRDGARRSNVGIVNLSISPIDVIVTVYDANGMELASKTVRVRTLSMTQESLQQLGVSELSTPGRVEVRIDPNSITWDPCEVDLEDLASLKGIFIAYLSRADQVTGDAEFILGVTDWREYIEECGSIPIGGF
jgi:hypothetical protein